MTQESSRSAEQFGPRISQYVGIDESNHGGQGKEIVVGVLSRHTQDVMPARAGLLPKTRSNTSGRLEQTIQRGYDYRFLLVDEGQARQAMYDAATKALVISSLIEAFGLENIERLLVIVDGVLPAGTKAEVSRRVSNGHGALLPGRIKYGPHADRKYPVVNLADAVAYALFDHYRSRGNVDPYHSRKAELLVA